jgi:hypothetical protein
VIGLDRIVRMPLDVMPCCRHKFLQYGRVDRRGVRYHLGRDRLERAQRSDEEPAGRLGVAARREQHVDDLPVLVDGPVDVAPDAVDLDVGLIDVPSVARAVASEPAGISQQRG